MTNKEWLATLSAEEWWNIVHEWLFHTYGKQWTDSREAILAWLSEEHDALKDNSEIVRCKDCINCIKESNGELYCDILAVGYEPLGSKKVNGDWFCADGKRTDT